MQRIYNSCDRIKFNQEEIRFVAKYLGADTALIISIVIRRWLPLIHERGRWSISLLPSRLSVFARLPGR